MPTLPSTRTRCKSPRKPTPPAPLQAAHDAFDLVKNSPMNRHAALIMTKADELRELLRVFLAKYDEDTYARILRKAGFDPNDRLGDAFQWDQACSWILEDMRGLEWALGVAAGVVDGNVLSLIDE
jgi:hypothetical protein